LPTFRDSLSVLSSGTKLPLLLLNSPEERSSQLLRGGSLKSRISIRDFRLPPRCKRDLRSSGMLCGAGW